VHAVDCCLLTYINNISVIGGILERIQSLLQNSKRLFLDQLKQGTWPSYAEFKNMTFKNQMLISLAK
jgi:hypothetical protein